MNLVLAACMSRRNVLLLAINSLTSETLKQTTVAAHFFRDTNCAPRSVTDAFRLLQPKLELKSPAKLRIRLSRLRRMDPLRACNGKFSSRHSTAGTTSGCTQP